MKLTGNHSDRASAGTGSNSTTVSAGIGNSVRNDRAHKSLVPICAYCMKIREAGRPADDRGAWHSMELPHSLEADVLFTHGMCPDCYDNIMKNLESEELTETQ